MKKKTLFIISSIVLLVSVFVSCSVHKNNENIETTAITDDNGITNYYEVVTDDSGNSSLYEIVTDVDGEVLTKKNGSYVTNKNTSKLHATSRDENNSEKNTTSAHSSNNKPTATHKNDSDDDDVQFGITTEDKLNNTTKITQTSPASTYQPSNGTTETEINSTIKAATDADGWITKWY